MEHNLSLIDRGAVSSSASNSRPVSVCEACWCGPFSFQMGTLSPKLDWRSNSTAESGGFKYTTSWKRIGFQADAGCRWCQLLLGARMKNEDISSGEPIDIVLGIIRKSRSFGVVINNMQRFCAILSAQSEDPASEFVHYGSMVLDVGSDRASNLCKDYMHKCISEHPNCTQPRDKPLPTRLIECSDPTHPKLVVTDGHTGTYAALSYVWGGPQIRATTQGNLRTYLQALSLAHLPQTIIDAITVTHRLGLRYLWVDSLCIIQDDDEDKNRELGRMRLVYRDAYITICAANAQSASQGFLEDRSAQLTSLSPSYEVTLPFICPNERRDIGQISITLLWIDSILPDVKHYEPSMEPVHLRAWCFQEFALSRRVLIFATHTLQFWCRDRLVNIGGSYNSASYPTYLPDALLQPDIPPDIVSGSKSWQGVRTSWKEMLKDYSSRISTLPQDRLVALAGVAEEFGRAFRVPYLAGLWQDALLAGLLWNKATNDCPKLPRPHNYRAPSWSWASVDGSIHAGPVSVDPTQSVAEVLSCEVSLKVDSLPFGEVVGGSLTVRAPLALCLLDASTPPRLYWVKRPWDLSKCELAASDALDDLAEVDRIGVFFHDSSDDIAFRVVYAMPVHVVGQWMTAGVVLLPTDLPMDSASESNDSDTRRFRRLGFFQSSHSGDTVGWVQQVPIMHCTVL